MNEMLKGWGKWEAENAGKATGLLFTAYMAGWSDAIRVFRPDLITPSSVTAEESSPKEDRHAGIN